MKKIVWGINAGFHDASLAVFEVEYVKAKALRNIQLKFASQSERFSRQKGDPDLSDSMIDYAITKFGEPELICWADKSKARLKRQFKAGQPIALANFPKLYMLQYGITYPIVEISNHACHDAYTRWCIYSSLENRHWRGSYANNVGHTIKNNENSVINIVVDSIGENESISVFVNGTKTVSIPYEKMSFGLFYSAFTERLNLKPNEEEYILMGMAAYGNYEKYGEEIVARSLAGKKYIKGCRDWRPDQEFIDDKFDVAAAVQKIYEDNLIFLVQQVINKHNLDTLTVSPTTYIALSGGCALNCVANSKVLAELAISTTTNISEPVNFYIPPNPGDAGNSIGAVLKHFEENRFNTIETSYIINVDNINPFTGYNIEGDYPIREALEILEAKGIVGVASGAAEFGPRALGHRSILADPRTIENKEKVNRIKQREQFRPFAPAILAENFNDYFSYMNSFEYQKHGRQFNFNGLGEHMQFVAECLFPDKIPAVVHYDGTSRVQNVYNVEHKSSLKFRQLLHAWKERTGTPVLLNTSLNIKGQPLVNTVDDAKDFERLYGIDVLTSR